MSKITDALAKLDPANDNHWTSDGLPRIDTVKMLAGDPTLTRETITAEMPNFSRQTAGLVAPTVAPDPVSKEPVGIVETKVVDYEVLYGEALATLQDAITARDKLNVVVAEKQNELDDIINARHAAGEASPAMSAVSGYLASQQNVLQERARRHAVLVESGVTLRDIQNLIPQRAPLDVALSGKKR